MGHMGARVFVMVESESEADAWVSVLRTLGMDILGRPSNMLSHDGSWTVRARAAQREQRHDPE